MIVFRSGPHATSYVKGMDSDMDLAVLSVEKDSLDADTISAISCFLVFLWTLKKIMKGDKA